MKTMMKALTITAATLGLTGAAMAQQGITATEVVIGSVNDLSGIFAAVGVPAVNGANLKFDEVNAAGGVNGRMIKFVVEDHGYQLPKATQGYNKLINRDEVFAMLLSLGTPHNLAGFQLMDPKGIFNINPLTAAREMLDEPVQNKFTGFSSYYDQIEAGLAYLGKTYGAKKACSMYLPTDFGKEIALSTKETAAAAGMEFVTETTHKPDEQDFVGAVQKLQAAGCDVVTMALGVRAGITVVGTAKQLGWTNVKFLASSAGFLEVVAAVPGGVTEGLYAAAGWQDMVTRMDVPEVKAFSDAYTARFSQPASGFAMLGYNAAETMILALEAAGADLTPDSFRTAMENLAYDSALTGTTVKYSPDNHQGVNDVVISRVEGGVWKTIAKQ
jgi:branched-chain amino acid transport system substrate-binding protein